MSKRRSSFFSMALTMGAMLAVPLLLGAKGSGCGGEVSLGDDSCDKSSCGAMPALACWDGSSPYTGKCVSKSDGTCGWEPRECPTKPTACEPCAVPDIACADGTTPYTGKCYPDAKGVCTPEYKGCGGTVCSDCSIPEIACADGSSPYTGKCVADPAGKCTAEYKGCPTSGDECDKSKCGPALGLPSWTCEDGTPGGNTGRCLKHTDGTCGWEVKDCPRKCTDAECGPVPPVAPCPGGSGPSVTCERKADGVCGWSVGTCAMTACEKVTAYPKACSSAADCTFGIHTINCCGSTVAMGYNKSAASTFAADEKACDDSYPGCGCAAMGTVDDDGIPGSAFAVDCVMGTCRTHSTKTP